MKAETTSLKVGRDMILTHTWDYVNIIYVRKRKITFVKRNSFRVGDSGNWFNRLDFKSMRSENANVYLSIRHFKSEMKELGKDKTHEIILRN